MIASVTDLSILHINKIEKLGFMETFIGVSKSIGILVFF